MKYLAVFVLSLFLLIECDSLMSSEELVDQHTMKKTYKDKMGITELALNNGMRVILKPTDDQDDEIFVRVFAKGGYSSFVGASQQIADIALQTGIESGVGPLSSKDKTIFLYEKSIDFTPKVDSYYRSVDASTPLDSIDDCLRLLKWYFSAPHFDRENFDKILKAQSKVNKQRNIYTEEEAAHLFLLAKNIHHQCFNNPAEFVCLIVGNFDPSKIESCLHKHLGSIPSQDHSLCWQHPQLINHLIEGGCQFVINEENQDCVVKMCFPVDKELSAEEMGIFKVACKVLENRINTTKYQEKAAIPANVQVELPFYPCLNIANMCIQFRCHQKDAHKITLHMMELMTKLCEEGPSFSESVAVDKELRENRSNWMKCNEFWLSSMTNYILWNGKLELIVDDGFDKKRTYNQVKNLLQKGIYLKGVQRTLSFR